MKDVFSQLALELPVFTAMAVGFFLAIVCWKNAPTSALLLAITMPTWLLFKLSMIFVRTLVPRSFSDAGMDYEQVRFFYQGTACVNSLVDPAALGLLIWAVFASLSTAPAK